MTAPPRSSRAPLAAAAAAFVVLLVAAGLNDGTVAGDARLASPRLVDIGRFVTSFGTSGYMFFFSALVAALAIWAERRGMRRWRGASLRLLAERALFFFATIAVSGILAQIIKHIVGRSRPALLVTDGPFHFAYFSIRDALASFPSGHTTSAFAAALALGYMAPRWRGALLCCAALIGLSRILVGAHFPSDVVGGAALGSLVAVMMVRGFARRRIAFVKVGDERIAALPLWLKSRRAELAR